MILSMTGFGSLNLVIPANGNTNINVTMTLKTLNSRFFEVNCKLPYSLTSLEVELVKLFKSKLLRGNVYFTLHMSNNDALITKVEPALNSIAGYLSAVEKIKQKLPVVGDLTISDLVTIPNLFVTNEDSMNEQSIQVIMDGINNLINQVISTREKEGKHLASDLQERIKKLENNLSELKSRAHVVMEQKRANLINNLKTASLEVGHEMSNDSQNLFIYNQLEKIDIHEELVRFKTHLDNYKSILDSNNSENGKKIDFVLQELFREINTIMAKCSDVQISSLGINIKVELEKSREQIQNII